MVYNAYRYIFETDVLIPLRQTIQIIYLGHGDLKISPEVIAELHGKMTYFLPFREFYIQSIREDDEYNPTDRALCLLWDGSGFEIRDANPKRTEYILELNDDSGEVIGAALLDLNRGMEILKLEYISTRTKAGPGNGRRVLQAVESFARKLQFKQISLEAVRDAIPFYLKSGYEHDDESPPNPARLQPMRLYLQRLIGFFAPHKWCQRFMNL